MRKTIKFKASKPRYRHLTSMEITGIRDGIVSISFDDDWDNTVGFISAKKDKVREMINALEESLISSDNI